MAWLDADLARPAVFSRKEAINAALQLTVYNSYWTDSDDDRANSWDCIRDYDEVLCSPVRA